MEKLTRLLAVLICLSVAGELKSAPLRDTIPYEGFRIHLTNVQLLKQKKDKIKIRYDIVNTGRRDIYASPNFPMPVSLAIEFDEALKNCQCQLAEYQSQISDQIRLQAIKLSAGQSIRGNVIQFRIEPALAKKDEALAQTHSEKEKKEGRKGSIDTRITDQPSNTYVPPAASGRTLPSVTSRKTSTQLNRGYNRSARIEEADSSTPPEDSLINGKAHQPKAEVLSPKGVEEIEAMTGCADVVVSDIKVKKQGKNSVILEYTLVNQGIGPAKLIHNTHNNKNNFAIKAFLNSTPNLTRGALPVGGVFIKSLPNNKEGYLFPNDSFKGTIKLDIRKKTRFTPNLILSVDPYLSVEECDRSNNNGFIKLN